MLRNLLAAVVFGGTIMALAACYPSSTGTCIDGYHLVSNARLGEDICVPNRYGLRTPTPSPTPTPTPTEDDG